MRAIAPARTRPATPWPLAAAGVGAVMLAEPLPVVPGAWPVTIAGAAALITAAAAMATVPASLWLVLAGLAATAAALIVSAG